MGAGITVDRLNVHLNGNWILRNLTFSVKPGEFVGIIGPNGAGKTTLLRTLLGMTHVESGTVSFMGNAHAPGATMVGYAPQSRQIDPETPIRAWDFVCFGLPHRFRPWLTKQDRRIVQEALYLTGSERLADKPLGKLSGGERQRLFIAQALVRNPQILLLDEPTSNLDPGAQENLASLICRINQEKGLTVLLVSHDVNLIVKYAHQILYLAGGHYAMGTVEQVLQANVLTRLYGVPVEVLQVGSKIVVSVSTANTLEAPICRHGDFREEVSANVSI